MSDLELYMVGLVVSDIDAALRFYRDLGVGVPDPGAVPTHVEVKMNGGLTFFLDSDPTRWDPTLKVDGHPIVLEFYLRQGQAVDAKCAELEEGGHRVLRAPFDTPFGMRFALVADPDGHVVLLSGDA